MKIGIPVQCQNGHKATWVVELRGLEHYHQGVPDSEKCDCPKHDFGMGYSACGEPAVIPPAPKVCECGPLRNITNGGHFAACTRCKRRI